MTDLQKRVAEVLRDFKTEHNLPDEFPGVELDSSRHAWVWILEEMGETLKEADPSLNIAEFKQACGYKEV